MKKMLLSDTLAPSKIPLRLNSKASGGIWRWPNKRINLRALNLLYRAETKEEWWSNEKRSNGWTRPHPYRPILIIPSFFHSGGFSLCDLIAQTLPSSSTSDY